MTAGSGWSRRNGTQYRRLCARAGCGALAVATLRFQSTEREAWLSELDDNAVRTQGDLCSRHATALVLPRGWELHDERPTAGPPAEIAPAGDASDAETASGAATPAPGRNGAPKPTTAKNGKAARRVRMRRPDRADEPVGAPADADQLPGFAAGVSAPTPAPALVANVTDATDATDATDGAAEPGPGVRPLPAPFGNAAVTGGPNPASEGGDGDDVEDALDAILDARTPLLQRAFRNARPL